MNGGEKIVLNPVVIYNERIKGWKRTYDTIARVVNNFACRFQLPPKPYKAVAVGLGRKHWGEVEKIFGSKSKLPDNVFVLDFVNPKGDRDLEYPTIKNILGQGGFLSQFVNFKTCRHDSEKDNDKRRSTIILSAVGRQMINKCGVVSWFVQLPEVPTTLKPLMLVGVDVFHAPRYVCRASY